jgi:hypothetical protein
MHRTTVATATTRPNRLLVALAAAWMILSIAIGGVVNAETNPDAATSQPITAVQP